MASQRVMVFVFGLALLLLGMTIGLVVCDAFLLEGRIQEAVALDVASREVQCGFKRGAEERIGILVSGQPLCHIRGDALHSALNDVCAGYRVPGP